MGQPLDPKVDHRITLDKAATLTRQYRVTHKGAYADAVTAFNAGPVLQLLQQKGCVGLRTYRATFESGATSLVLVGVDEKGNDMVDGIILEEGFPCPPFCSDDNALNT
ncbi:MAG: hypothetical protein IT357_10825 [Gemmatimonadaceae bacterium]|nr:hypothetical protein [Gemmatimonadaceae bacterium]